MKTSEYHKRPEVRERVKEYHRKHPEQVKASLRRYYQKHREKRLEYMFYARLKRVYGITRAEYELRRDEQAGVCAICKNPPDSRGLAIDHCHATGKIRGLLCNKCNCALGQFSDSLERLNAAILYLKNHE